MTVCVRDRESLLTNEGKKNTSFKVICSFSSFLLKLLRNTHPTLFIVTSFALLFSWVCCWRMCCIILISWTHFLSDGLLSLSTISASILPPSPSFSLYPPGRFCFPLPCPLRLSTHTANVLRVTELRRRNASITTLRLKKLFPWMQLHAELCIQGRLWDWNECMWEHVIYI